MNLKAQRDLSIAGDVVGRDKITINLTRGLDELPTRYDSRVQNFLEYYLGAKDHPAPFGGRASDLAALDAWLNDPTAPRYASLIAPAGRGKSALLAHWITRLASRPATGAEAVHVVYFPISIRFNTNLETVVFASLAGRMAHIYGEKVTQAVDAQQYRGVFSDSLRRTPPNGGRVLVVLDGLDEAAGWEAGADLFPTVAPNHLRVIVAARPLALDKDETAWLNRLGWEMPNHAQRLSLAGLDREGVRDVLSQMGNPLDALATKIDLISKLYELSAGDPLLVRLYVEALLPQGAQAATLTPDDLAKLQPGLEAYFKRWFEEQQKLWGAAKPLQDKTVRGLLNLCAAALGPLKKDDVLALAPDIFEDSGLLDEAAVAVNRFIIGDGLASGYVFSHPRLAEYFAAKLTERERQAWQARFLQYGRDTLTALENKTLLPKNAPAYVVQYYAAHLTQVKASATDFYALVCESWLRAWEWLEGTPAGFLNDADRAWQQAEAEGSSALGQQIRAALCFASVTSLSASIPKDLLVACVKAGVISPALGLVMARQKPDPRDRAECLAAIAEFQPSESHAIMREALSAARAISVEESRARVLGELAPRLPEREQADVLAEALSTARMISSEWDRPRVLGEIASRLFEHEKKEVLDEALSSARVISLDQARAEVLGALAQQLPEREQAVVLREALSAAHAISDEWFRASVLGALTPQLPKREQEEVLGEALSVARAISDRRFRARLLAELAPRLAERELMELLGEALSAPRAIFSELHHVIVLKELAPRLPESLLREMFSAAQAISNEESRAHVLGELAPSLPKSLLMETLSAARAIFNEKSRAQVLEALAPRLPEREQADVLREALSAARMISDEEFRAYVLVDLAPRLPELEQTEVLVETLSTARSISDERSQANVLDKLVPQFPEFKQANMLKEVLSMARAISDGGFRASVLGKLAQWLPEREQTDVLRETLSMASAISLEWARARILKELAPRLPESLLKEALTAARTISEERFRAEVLDALAPRLPEREQAEVLREALLAARAISDEKFRAEVLRELAPHLPEREQAKVLEEALLAARTISDEWDRVNALKKLASRLPESLLDEALSAIRAISGEWDRIEVLMELAPRLPESLLREVLSAARTNYHVTEWARANVLGTLVPWLPEREQMEVLGEALSMARAISDEGSRADVLGELALRMPKREQVEILGEALSAARAISDEGSRTRTLEKLAPWLPESLLDEALQMLRALCHHEVSIAGFPEWNSSIAVLSNLATRWSAVCRSTQRSEFEELSATLRAFARTKRPQLLQAIQALLPVIAAQDPQGRVLRETARAIVDTAKWWP